MHQREEFGYAVWEWKDMCAFECVRARASEEIGKYEGSIKALLGPY